MRLHNDLDLGTSNPFHGVVPGDRRRHARRILFWIKQRSRPKLTDPRWRATHYQWLDENPTYPARFQEAMRIGIRTLEDEAVRRAYEGVKKLVFWKGKPVHVNGELVYETEYDSNLLMFLLKAYDRKRFGEKSQVVLYTHVPGRCSSYLKIRWATVDSRFK